MEKLYNKIINIYFKHTIALGAMLLAHKYKQHCQLFITLDAYTVLN